VPLGVLVVVVVPAGPTLVDEPLPTMLGSVVVVVDDVGVETAVVVVAFVVSVVPGVVAAGSLPAHATSNAAAGIDRKRLFMASLLLFRGSGTRRVHGTEVGETCRGAFGASVAPLLLR
jgi:hypothetical protein